MSVKRITAVSAAVLAVAGGAAGAVAATSGDAAKKAEQAVLDDAAKRLNVSPDDLRSALGAAEDAQLDQAVKDGELTQEQADAMKARRSQEGRVLGFGHGHGHGPGHLGGRLGGRGPAREAAAALGITERELRAQLRDGKSIADVAKAQGKDLDEVKKAIRAAVAERLDEALKAGRITAEMRTRKLERLDEHIDDLVERSFERPFGRPRR